LALLGNKEVLAIYMVKTRWLILPFENRTQIVSAEWPFEYQTVRYSDGYCMWLSGFDSK
jgi:hypothetical protein